MKKIKELEALAREMVGDGKSPNLFFVSRKGAVQMVTESFESAYTYWKCLPRNIETMLEDRQWGVIADTSLLEVNSNKLTTQDDSSIFLKLHKLTS